MDLGRAGFTASAGGEKMDPGQKQHGWLPLMERESWFVWVFLIAEIFLGSRAGLDEPLRLSKARAFLWQGGRGCPPAPACAKGGVGQPGLSC